MLFIDYGKNKGPNNNMKMIGIYPVASQPPTKAHLVVYNKLKSIVGVDTFIVTTDRTPTEDAPLNFGDKVQILVRHGIPSSHIIQSDDWKHPTVILNNFSKDQTKIIYALNSMDVKKLTSKSKYYQLYNKTSIEPLSKRGYILVIDDTKIEGKPVSTQNIRQVLGSDRYEDGAKKKFFRFIFGWFDVGLYTLITSKFKSAHQVFTPDTEVKNQKMPSMSSMISKPQPIAKKTNGVKSRIQQMVREMLGEIMNEEFYSKDVNTPDAADNMTAGTDQLKSPADQRAEASKKKIELSKQNSQNKKDLTAMNADEKWKRTDLLAMRQKKIDAQTKINATNKLIANPSSLTP